ncbi:hypothetical protein CDCA_CDCA01G0422 [Cyanidium caldarium]|uniref:Guanylyl cyclase n=1 Tax=Cyanidium caldarium TaxID=2771 RepID=A0AAV9IQ87_CYACA|nr:hypothetical protein CDCA_CDCA01G0422 [Cyanidium caldarium]
MRWPRLRVFHGREHGLESASRRATGSRDDASWCALGRVPRHVPQRHSWDCGLACVALVLECRGWRPIPLSMLMARAGTRSVWSIDLVHVLRTFGVRPLLFYTSCAGVRPEYARLAFYQRHLKRDTGRVRERFAQAEADGTVIELRELSSADLVRLVCEGVTLPTKTAASHTKALVIALVDQRYLLRQYAALAPKRWWQRLWPASDPLVGDAAVSPAHVLPSESFVGHYVVILGYDGLRDEYLLNDPAQRTHPCRVPRLLLDVARSAYGTDGDTIVIPL